VRARRGVALLAALWLVIAIAAVALQFSLDARERRALGIAASERGQQRAAAAGGLAFTQARLDQALRQVGTSSNATFNRLRSSDPWLGVDSLISGVISVDSMGVDVRARDLGTQLNLNSLNEVDLRTLFAYVTGDYVAADQLAQRIMDWRDADSLPRTRGAERDQYIKAERLALPTNGPFREVSELLDVMGMTPQIYDKVRPYLRTRGGPLVNVNTAPPAVLRALPGMTDATLNMILSLRSQGRRIDNINQIFGSTGGGGRGGAGGHAAAPRGPASDASALGARVREHHRGRADDLGPGGTAGAARAAHRDCQSRQQQRRDDDVDLVEGMVEMSAASGKGRSVGRVRAGVALSTTELYAADLGARSPGGRSMRIPLDPPSAEGGSWPSLTSALAELARSLGAGDGGGTLLVSLMPPLTELRRLELPPLGDDDLRRVLSRNASKYFVNARSPQLVGTVRGVRGPRGAPAAVVAAAAPARLVTAIQASARAAGWSVAGVGPAESAWASAATAFWPAHARGTAHLLVAHDDRADLLELEDGKLAGVRRFRAGAADAQLIAQAVAGARGGRAASLGAIGSGDMGRELARALTARGVAIASASSAHADLAGSVQRVAAQYAAAENGPVFRGDELVAARRAEARRATMFVAAAAVSIVCLAAALELWGVNRELRVVRAERERLRPRLATTLVGRTTVAQAYQHLSTLASFERGSPQLTAVITAITAQLPGDAYLTGLRARGDSLVIEGLADRAARVFDAIERTPGLTSVRAAAPVRREIVDDGVAKERFTIAALLPPASASRAQTPTGSASAAAATRRAGQ
jgi:general secretion pathway protein K